MLTLALLERPEAFLLLRHSPSGGWIAAFPCDATAPCDTLPVPVWTERGTVSASAGDVLCAARSQTGSVPQIGSGPHAGASGSVAARGALGCRRPLDGPSTVPAARPSFPPILPGALDADQPYPRMIPRRVCPILPPEASGRRVVSPVPERVPVSVLVVSPPPACCRWEDHPGAVCPASQKPGGDLTPSEW